jgi:hypothetical protein
MLVAGGCFKGKRVFFHLSNPVRTVMSHAGVQQVIKILGAVSRYAELKSPVDDQSHSLRRHLSPPEELV